MASSRANSVLLLTLAACVQNPDDVQEAKSGSSLVCTL